MTNEERKAALAKKLEYDRKWRDEHPDYIKQWREKNPEKQRAIYERGRRKRGLPVYEQGPPCPECGSRRRKQA